MDWSFGSALLSLIWVHKGEGTKENGAVSPHVTGRAHTHPLNQSQRAVLLHVTPALNLGFEHLISLLQLKFIHSAELPQPQLPGRLLLATPLATVVFVTDHLQPSLLTAPLSCLPCSPRLGVQMDTIAQPHGSETSRRAP